MGRLWEASDAAIRAAFEAAEPMVRTPQPPEELYGVAASFGSEVLLDANRGDEETWRIERLQRVLGFMDGRGIAGKIAHLYDSKGALTVTWCQQPSLAERQVAVDAWAAVCECGVEHRMAPLPTDEPQADHT